MVQDKGQPGQRPDRVDRGGQLVRQRQQVVCEPGRCHRVRAPPHVRTGQPARVRLTLHQVADARQACAARSRAQGGERLRNGSGGKVGPADYAGYQIRLTRQGQELGRLGQAGKHLDENRAVDADGLGVQREVGQGEVPTPPGMTT